MSKELFELENQGPLEETAETVLEAQNQDASIKVLAASLAHELANPIAVIRGYVNLTLDEVMEDSLAREYLLRAKKGIAQVMHIMGDLRAFLRPGHEGKPNLIEVHELICESLDVIREDEAFRQIVIRELFCEERPVYVEDRGLSTLLRNLYKNAQQAMGEEGMLTVATWVNNGSVGVAVQDSAGGVPEDIRGRIFEPFFSTKSRSEGAGIGLALCREIVERSGGRLTCGNSVSPPGACFMFTLPRKAVPGPEIFPEKIP